MPSTKPSPSEADERTLCAMKLRMYPTGSQAGRLGHWLYCAHRFRNEAAGWLKEYRKKRAIWFAQNPWAKALKGEALTAVLPPNLAVNPINACSSWLTVRLQQARAMVPRELGLPAEERSMRAVGEAVHSRLKNLTRLERDELTDAWLLTVPRTVFDQVLQDLKKTWSKALKDRKDKRRKPAGFPKQRKFSYATSIRVQLTADKNQAVREHWAQGEVFIPGLGQLRFKDAGYVLPKTPPSLFTLGRDAAGRIHATFVCVDGEGPWAGEGTVKRKERWNRKSREQGQTGLAASSNLLCACAPLPIDPKTGLPKIGSIDLGLSSRSTSAEGKKSGRVRHLKRYARRFRRLNKKLSRQQYGSKRWQKTKRDIGRTHTKVVFQRDALLNEEAQSLVADHAILCLETLFLAFLMKNRSLAQSAADAALGKFQKKLELEAAKKGHLILRCGQFDASTKTCSVCKTKNPNLKLRHRSWTCGECGTHHDRDINAAVNIQEMALTRAISPLSTVPESGIGAGLPTGLHPDLALFVARGGLTALLGHRSRESQAEEACVLPKQSRLACRERVKRG
jgi:transposase